MKYKKGQIIDYDFPKQYKKTKVLSDSHRAIILHTRETPYNTVLIAPITSLTSLRTWSEVPSNYLELKSSDYPGILERDSFVNLDMIMSVDNDKLRQFERNGIKIISSLIKEDMYNLDVRLVLTYELKKYIKSEINAEVSNVVKYIDGTIKCKVSEILKFIENDEIKEKLTYIIDNDLIGVLKKEYLNSEK